MNKQTAPKRNKRGYSMFDIVYGIKTGDVYKFEYIHYDRNYNSYIVYEPRSQWYTQIDMVFKDRESAIKYMVKRKQ